MTRGDSGDGYLSTWDIRKPDVAAMSDHMEDELLSVALVKVNLIILERKRDREIYISCPTLSYTKRTATRRWWDRKRGS